MPVYLAEQLMHNDNFTPMGTPLVEYQRLKIPARQH